MKYTKPAKKVMFDYAMYENLLDDITNAVGNLDSYLTECKLKENEIGGCCAISDYGILLGKCCAIGDNYEEPEITRSKHKKLKAT